MSMGLTSHVSLRPYNSFGLEVRAEALADFTNASELRQALGCPFEHRMVLGGGSNVLFTTHYNGLILLNRIGGLAIEEDRGEEVIVSAGAGVNWHDLVEWCLAQGLNGVENLSLIPGTAGAAPIQNIGAYGVELKDVFYALQAIDLSTGEEFNFDATACRFGYRSSIFKEELKGRMVITKIFLRLTRRQDQLSLEYGAIQDELVRMNVRQPSARDVSQAVMRIRRSKLPDPATLGNAGSFFKNPEVPSEEFAQLLDRFPDMPSYPLPDGSVKVPAGWLIERAGWKGRRTGNVGCYTKQALVLVNYGGATGEEIWSHACQVADSVEAHFGLRLVPEVNVVGHPSR